MNKEVTLYQKTKALLKNETVLERFAALVGGDSNARHYVTSVLNAVAVNDRLQECNPNSIIYSAMNAAALHLTVEPSQGHAYLVPYGDKCTFIIGYKGMIQLAHRTGKYRLMHDNVLTQKVQMNPITGEWHLTGEPSDEKIYTFFFRLVDGIEHFNMMTETEVKEHAAKYSYAYKKGYDSPWKTDFDKMALKTVIRQSLSKYGYFDNDTLMAMALEEKLADDEELNEIFVTADGEVIDAETVEEQPDMFDDLDAESFNTMMRKGK